MRQSVEGHRANTTLPLADRVRLMEEEKRRLQMALEVLEMEELHVLDAEQLYQPPVSNQEVEQGQGLGQGPSGPMNNNHKDGGGSGSSGESGNGRPDLAPINTHPTTGGHTAPATLPPLGGHGVKPAFGHASFLAELNDKKANLRKPTFAVPGDW